MHIRKAGLFLALVILLSPVSPLQAQGGPLVLAFYYARWDANTWSLPLPDSPVQPYSSDDPTVIELHVVQAKRAGLDALIQFWQGAERDGNPSESNFITLLEKSGHYQMKAAVAVDVYSPLLPTVDKLTASLGELRDRHARNSAYLQTAGKPVIFFLGQARYSADSWNTIRQQIDPQHTMIWIAEASGVEYLQAFDGFYYYNINKAQDPTSLEMEVGGAVRTWSAQQGRFRYWVGTVSPGYNDRVLHPEAPLVRERDQGNYYDALWHEVVRSSPDWILINSFNGWTEGSQIEPSQLTSDTYLNQTAYLVGTFRSLPPRPTPTFTPQPPTATPTPTLTLTPTPIPPTVVSPLPTATPEPPTPLPPEPTLTPSETPFRLPTPTPPVAVTLVGVGTGNLPADNIYTPIQTGIALASPTPTYSPFLPVESVPPESRFCSGSLFPLGLGFLGWMLFRVRTR